MNKNFFFITLFFTLLTNNIYAQISVCSWNLENFGKSKTDEAITFIANTVKGFDVICIVEVVAGDGGAPAVARLSDELNRKGAKWDYSISDPTAGNPYKSERYAFIWKTSKLKKKGRSWLEEKYKEFIEREPYFSSFDCNGKEFTLVAFHAITKSKQPETEIKYFKFLPAEYPDKNLIFAGDFNCPQSHSVFDPLKAMGYLPIFTGQRTSLRQKCLSDGCLASEFDNIFFNKVKVNFIKSGIIPFYDNFTTLKEARKISDHVPIYFQFSLN